MSRGGKLAKNTIILAIITGLAVMAKTSGAIVSLPIMYIFLLIIEHWRNLVWQ